MSTAAIKLGVIVPSSNTALEPLTNAIIAAISTKLRPVTVHYTRIPVTQINLSDGSSAQFAQDAFVGAAQLLVDAKVDAIGWSGTSAGWLGFERDEKLCKMLSERFGIPFTTSTLALNRVLERFPERKLGLVTPYSEDMNQVIMKNYAALGSPITAERERHLSIGTNQLIAEVNEETWTRLVHEVVGNGADVVTTFCTNMNAAHLVEKWETDLKVPVFDSVATVVWDLCRITGVDMSGAHEWGRMFR